MRTCHVAVALELFSCGRLSETMVHVPGIGSTTSTSAGSVLAFASRTSYELSYVQLPRPRKSVCFLFAVTSNESPTWSRTSA